MNNAPANGLPPRRISRRRIGEKLRVLRTARRWSQADLAARLAISQPSLSKVERGAGSLTAEQFLTVLALFNVGAGEFVPETISDETAGLQNLLARLGASDLQERTDILPSARLEGNLVNVFRETLLRGTPRLLTALAPVLVANANQLPLAQLEARLAEAGLERRLTWLLETTLEALTQELASPLPATLARRYRRATAVIETYLESAAPRLERSRALAPESADLLDPEIRSRRTREQVAAGASAISKRWGIITSLKPEDFAHALRSTHGPHD